MLYFGLIDEKISTSEKDLPVKQNSKLRIHSKPDRNQSKLTVCAMVAAKNMGLGCNSGPCSAGHFLIMHPSSVFSVKQQQQ